jgi:hypothetical protein
VRLQVAYVEVHVVAVRDGVQLPVLQPGQRVVGGVVTAEATCNSPGLSACIVLSGC